MLPIRDSNHVAEGLALIIGQYKADPGLKALATVLLTRVQEAEDMLWDVSASQLLTSYAPGELAPGTAQGQASGPPPQALLQLADLVQCPVGTFTTTELAFLLNIWLLARKSHGLSEDLIGILAAGFGAGNFNYAEFFPAAFEATVINVPSAPMVGSLAQALTIARPPGVSGALAWGTWPAGAVYGQGTFFFGSDGTTPGSGLASPYGDGRPLAGLPPTNMGLLAEVIV